MADKSKSEHQQPLLANGEEVGPTTVQVDNIITGGAGEFHELQDGDQIPPERYLQRPNLPSLRALTGKS